MCRRMMGCSKNTMCCVCVCAFVLCVFSNSLDAVLCSAWATVVDAMLGEHKQATQAGKTAPRIHKEK
jgi:hypothetical protein